MVMIVVSKSQIKHSSMINILTSSDLSQPEIEEREGSVLCAIRSLCFQASCTFPLISTYLMDLYYFDEIGTNGIKYKSTPQETKLRLLG